MYFRESTVDEPEGIKPAFMSKAKARRVDEGNNKVIFEFRLIAAPRPTICWFHNDQPIEETSRRRMSMYADVHLYILTLELSDINPEDDGVYRIEARNKEGVASATVVLEVNRKLSPAIEFTSILTQICLWFDVGFNWISFLFKLI